MPDFVTGLSTSFSILDFVFQFGAFVSITASYEAQLSVVGTVSGGFDAKGTLAGMMQVCFNLLHKYIV